MKHVTYFAVLALFVVVTAPPLGWIVPSAMADGGGFSKADIDGDYGFKFSGGFVDQIFGVPIVLPVSAVGQFTVNRGRNAELTRTMNIGGGIVQDTFKGEIDFVNPDGTGRATFCTETRRSEIDDFPGFTKEVFSFVITGEDNSEIEFIGTRTWASRKGCLRTAGDPLPVSVQGTARKQDVDGDD